MDDGLSGIEVNIVFNFSLEQYILSNFYCVCKRKKIYIKNSITGSRKCVDVVAILILIYT